MSGDNTGGRESKREKFVRLAETRTNKILDMMELLGNLSNTNAYEYTQADVDQIFNALESQLKDTKRRFQTQPDKKTARFSLKSK